MLCNLSVFAEITLAVVWYIACKHFQNCRELTGVGLDKNNDKIQVHIQTCGLLLQIWRSQALHGQGREARESTWLASFSLVGKVLDFRWVGSGQELNTSLFCLV